FGGSGADRGQAIAVDASGNVAITGYFSLTADFGAGPLTSAGAHDVFVAEYTSAGAPLWSKRFGDTSDDIGASLAFDRSGRVVVTGDYYGTIDFGGGALVSVGGGNMFLAMLSSTGAHVWSKRFGIGGNSAAGVTVDTAGNVIMTGTMVGAADFGGGPLWGNGSFDIFLAKFNNAGAHVWSKRFGDLSDDHGNGVASDPSGNVILTGDYFLSVDFGGGALPSPGSSDAFLVKFGP
ncbi:MAG TPA: nucleotide-binding protein, partial [Candidatus Polarisedimenticolia bacterium]|nr:nucleotide-binding protein [Candidatus Polarisedimenticolia bacterium]